MRDTLKGLIAGLVLLAIAGALAGRAGWIVAAVPRADGTGPWLLARATGLVAYAALGLDVIAGLALSTRAGGIARGELVELHRWLAPLALGLVLVHGGVLLADGHVRFDALDVLVPFASTRAVALGVLAGYLALVVHASFALRKRLGTATWRRLHHLAFVAFALATLHAVAGTDRTHPWFVAVYAIVLGAVGALLARRIRGVTRA